MPAYLKYSFSSVKDWPTVDLRNADNFLSGERFFKIVIEPFDESHIPNLVAPSEFLLMMPLTNLLKLADCAADTTWPALGEHAVYVARELAIAVAVLTIMRRESTAPANGDSSPAVFGAVEGGGVTLETSEMRNASDALFETAEALARVTQSGATILVVTEQAPAQWRELVLKPWGERKNFAEQPLYPSRTIIAQLNAMTAAARSLLSAQVGAGTGAAADAERLREAACVLTRAAVVLRAFAVFVDDIAPAATRRSARASTAETTTTTNDSNTDSSNHRGRAVFMSNDNLGSASFVLPPVVSDLLLRGDDGAGAGVGGAAASIVAEIHRIFGRLTLALSLPSCTDVPTILGEIDSVITTTPPPPPSPSRNYDNRDRLLEDSNNKKNNHHNNVDANNNNNNEQPALPSRVAHARVLSDSAVVVQQNSRDFVENENALNLDVEVEDVDNGTHNNNNQIVPRAGNFNNNAPMMLMTRSDAHVDGNNESNNAAAAVDRHHHSGESRQPAISQHTTTGQHREPATSPVPDSCENGIPFRDLASSVVERALADSSVWPENMWKEVLLDESDAGCDKSRCDRGDDDDDDGDGSAPAPAPPLSQWPLFLNAHIRVRQRDCEDGAFTSPLMNTCWLSSVFAVVLPCDGIMNDAVATVVRRAASVAEAPASHLLSQLRISMLTPARDSDDKDNDNDNDDNGCLPASGISRFFPRLLARPGLMARLFGAPLTRAHTITSCFNFVFNNLWAECGRVGATALRSCWAFEMETSKPTARRLRYWVSSLPLAAGSPETLLSYFAAPPNATRRIVALPRVLFLFVYGASTATGFDAARFVEDLNDSWLLGTQLLRRVDVTAMIFHGSEHFVAYRRCPSDGTFYLHNDLTPTTNSSSTWKPTRATSAWEIIERERPKRQLVFLSLE